MEGAGLGELEWLGAWEEVELEQGRRVATRMLARNKTNREVGVCGVVMGVRPSVCQLTKPRELVRDFRPQACQDNLVTTHTARMGLVGLNRRVTRVKP